MPGATPVESLWHHLNFRRLWIGETVSQFGSAVTAVALPLTAILVLKASTLEVGLLATFTSAAWLLVGLPSGAWVDRMRLDLVLVVNDLIRLIALGSVPVAYAFGGLTIGQLYAVGLITSASTVFFDVAYQAYLPQLVGPEALVSGNAQLQAGESVAQVAAPALAGTLIELLTAPYAILVDAASFLWSAIWVGRITVRSPKPERKADRHLVREVKEGLRFVLGNRILRSIALCTSVSNLCSSMIAAVIYILMARNLHLSAGWIGVLNALPALGGIVGSLLASRLARRFGQGPTIVASAFLAIAPEFVLPFVQHNWSLGLMVLASTIGWASVVVYNVTQVSFRQRLCPPELMGRMTATVRFLVWGTMPIGALIGGLLGSTVGVRTTILIAVLIGLLAPITVALSPLRRMRELPDQVGSQVTT